MKLGGSFSIRQFTLTLVRHTLQPSTCLLFYYLHRTSHNLNPNGLSLHTKPTTLSRLHGIPSAMSLKRSNSSFHQLIDATNTQPAEKTIKGTTIVLQDGAWSLIVP